MEGREEVEDDEDTGKVEAGTRGYQEDDIQDAQGMDVQAHGSH